MLKLQNVSVTIENKKILNNVSFVFEEGKTYAIMGPNGSGKSTVAHTIMGHPSHELTAKSKITLGETDLTEMEPNERADEGVFLSFQTPMSLQGVTIHNLLRVALNEKVDPKEVRKRIKENAAKLNISEDLLKRPLGEGFSGGEKKKMEALQAAVIQPKVLIFDEIDTGVDVDALKTITKLIKQTKKDNPSAVVLVITHNARILQHIKPDKVVIVKDGGIAKEGPYSLAQTIDKEGYEKI